MSENSREGEETRSVFLALCEAVDDTFNIQPLMCVSSPTHDQLMYIPTGVKSQLVALCESKGRTIHAPPYLKLGCDKIDRIPAQKKLLGKHVMYFCSDLVQNF